MRPPLAVVLLAQLAAVLPRDADRVLALFREAGVIDDRGLDRAECFDLRQRHLTHFGQHSLIGPGGDGDEMQQ